MNDIPDKLIRSEIKTRSVTYYLTSEEDLGSVKTNSLLGDIFTALAFSAIGGIISTALTKATGIKLEQETVNVLNILFYVFILLSIIFAAFALYFHYHSFAAIKKIKGSGTVKSVQSGNHEEKIVKVLSDANKIESAEPKLEIIKAEYWTPNVRLDVTKELRNKIADNRLEVFANNDIKPPDPDRGTKKKLTIEYKFDGITVTKEFLEYEKMIIP